jgi:hypothetical protein
VRRERLILLGDAQRLLLECGVLLRDARLVGHHQLRGLQELPLERGHLGGGRRGRGRGRGAERKRLRLGLGLGLGLGFGLRVGVRNRGRRGPRDV